MNTIKTIFLSMLFLVTIIVLSGLSENTTSCQKSDAVSIKENIQKQTINMFVTHGHCSSPFTGIVEDLKVVTYKREGLGNALDGMEISFQLDPNLFNELVESDITRRIKTPGLFLHENDQNISFSSTSVYKMGLDWYQVNGIMSIKGVLGDVKLFATGIRNSKETMPSYLVLEGQLNLFDWGIDYDKIVNGKSDQVPTKWMYLNMKIDMSNC